MSNTFDITSPPADPLGELTVLLMPSVFYDEKRKREGEGQEESREDAGKRRKGKRGMGKGQGGNKMERRE